MKEKKQPMPKKGAPAWMATFSDLMTLLLCFFVMLFGMSSIDTSKFAAFINSYNGSTGIIDGGEVLLNDAGMIGGGVSEFPNEKEIIEEFKQEQSEQTISDMLAIKEELENYITSEELENKVKVEQNSNEVVLTFEDVALFDSGKADIKPDSIPILDKIGTKILSYTEKGYLIRAEGHTDNVPISTPIFPSNWELSASRAIAIAKFYIEELGFLPKKISAEGFGEYYPVADNSTIEGRNENRRVEIKIVKDLMSE